MTTTFSGHLLGPGTHAARPAVGDVPEGTLYSCADHGLVYQSDGATWDTWATLGGDVAAHEADTTDVHGITDTSALATSSDVDAAIAALVDSSPAALDTLAELADALGDDPDFATTVNNAIAERLTETQADALYRRLDALISVGQLDGTAADEGAIPTVQGDGSVAWNNGASDALWSPPNNQPVAPSFSSPGTLPMDALRVYWCGYFMLPTPRTLSKLSMAVVSGGDGASVIRIGTARVSDDGVIVGEALTEHGTIDGTSATQQSITGIDASLPAGRIGLFCSTDSQTSSTPTVRAGTHHFANVGVHDLDAALRNRGRASAASGSHNGTLPATVPASVLNLSSGGPIVALEFSA